MSIRVRTPQLPDIEKAVYIYYSKTELKNKDISELFGDSVGIGTIQKLKKKAKELMRQEEIEVFNGTCVDTVVAYKAWGIDINDLETRLNKLRKLKMRGD